MSAAVLDQPASASAPASLPAAVAAGAPLLSLRGMSKRFDTLQALDDVSVDIAAGEIHCLLGENGAGKSTLCNLIFGVYAPDAGEMLLGGQPHRPQGPADALARGIAMVHQHFSLVPDLTVVDTVAWLPFWLLPVAWGRWSSSCWDSLVHGSAT